MGIFSILISILVVIGLCGWKGWIFSAKKNGGNSVMASSSRINRKREVRGFLLISEFVMENIVFLGQRHLQIIGTFPLNGYLAKMPNWPSEGEGYARDVMII